jgi:hypothetical protein
VRLRNESSYPMNDACRQLLPMTNGGEMAGRGVSNTVLQARVAPSVYNRAMDCTTEKPVRLRRGCFCLHHCISTGSGAHYYSKGSRGSFPGNTSVQP